MNIESTPEPTMMLPGQPDQWLQATPRLRCELNVDLRKQKSRLVAIIEDPVRSRFFQVGNIEYHFLMMLDGKRPVSEIIQAMQHGRGYSTFSADSAKAICNWLASMNLLDTPGSSNSGRLCQAAQAKEKQQLVGLMNPVSFRVNLLNPDQTLRKIAPWTQWLFTPLMVVVWLIVGVLAWTLVNSDYDRFCRAANGILAADRWLWLLIVWVLLKIVHETAHGVACQKYGGEVPQAGLLFLLFAPLAFVNVTSSWRFSSRKQRMVVSAAGMYVELLVAFIAIIFWYYTDSQWVSDLAYNVVIMAGISTVLFNANPLLRFDGYYLLSDMLGIVNLYGKGQNWFGDRARHLIFGFPIDPRVCPESEHKMVVTYGICSFVWRILLCVSLLLVASTLFGGAGLAFALIGAVFWVGMPLIQNYKKVKLAASTNPIDKKRLTLVALSFSGLIALCFFGLQAPALTSAPAIVQFKNEQIMRASADGFVQEILVRDGQKVEPGEIMVRLDNPDLVHELETLKRSADVSMIQARIHRQHNELSLQQAEMAKLRSIQEQVNELQSQVENLEIKAPFKGVVFGRALTNLQGSFVKQGDVILHFADPAKKEIRISIDQEQIRTVKSHPDSNIRFAFRGVDIFSSSMSSIDPGASNIPLDPAMTVPNGGSLTVVASGRNEDSESDYRLISPRFTGKCQLDRSQSTQVLSGQRGIAYIQGRDVSLGGFLILKTREWIRGKLQIATQAQ